MANGNYERSLINRACKKLGHAYSTTPDAIAIRLLLPFHSGRFASSKKKRRQQLAMAAKLALEAADARSGIVPQKRAPAHKPERPTSSKKKKPDGFYSSWEWKAARYEALKLQGRRCQCCGWRPGDTAHGHLVVDHIKPRSKHPELALSVSNLQVLCNDCNMGKSNIWADDFRDVDDWFATIMRS